MTVRDEGGFIMLEVILAVFLLAIGLYALIQGLSRCIVAAGSVQNYNIAQTMLANKSFEFDVERADDVNPQNGQFSDFPQFTWTRALDSTDQPGLWQQTITVYWTERGDRASDSVVEYRYLPQKTQ